MAAVVTLDRLQGLLRERGLAHSLPWRGESAPAPPPLHRAEALDTLLTAGSRADGFTKSPGASGCTAAALAMTAAVHTREATAISMPRQFSPSTARQADVDLHRLLLVRCQWPREAWDAVNLVVGAGGFGLIVLDLMGTRSRRFLQEWQMRPWLKLQRGIENTRSILLVAATCKGIAAHAAAARVEFRRKEARWNGRPGVSLVLGGMQVEATLAYQRHPQPAKRTLRREQSCTLELEATG